MPKASPFSSTKISGSFFSTLYFYCFIYYVLFLERLCFSFQFSLVLSAVIIGCIPALFVLERDMLRFHCIEHSGFIPIHLRVFSFLLAVLLVFVLFRTFKFCFVVRCVQLSDL